MEKDELQLISKAQGGDNAALEIILHKYKNLVRSASRKFFLIGGDADDLLQEGTIGLLHAIKHFDTERCGGGFTTYASNCIKSKIIDTIRHDNREKNKILNNSARIEDDASELENRTGTDDPLSAYLEQESASDFYGELQKTFKLHEVEVLKLYLEGYSYKEISVRLGLATKKVDNLIWKIKQYFREKLV
jgi:RNA polymerase sporulation-specific sigma factor